MAAAVAAVLSYRDGIFALKKKEGEQERIVTLLQARQEFSGRATANQQEASDWLSSRS